MRLSREDLRAMHDRLLVAETVPLPRVVRDVLVDARRVYVEFLVRERPSLYTTSRRGREMADRRRQIVEYSDEHGVVAAAAHFGLTTRRVYTIRYIVKKRAAA